MRGRFGFGIKVCPFSSKRRNEMALALEGVKVIDTSQVVAVPMAARHLADFGADVIHVEKPNGGDAWRTNTPPVNGVNYNWESINRNKRSISLDLKRPEGQEVLYKLVEGADVFVTNLRLMERDKYNLEYETLRKLNPRIIYCSLTGHGKEGPDKNLPAYDTTAAWYRSGAHFMLSVPGMPNVGFRSGFVDTVASMALFAGVTTALYTREITGIGQEIEVSLLNIGIYQLTYDISRVLIEKPDPNQPPPAPPEPQDEEGKRRRKIVDDAHAAVARLSELYAQFNPWVTLTDYRTKEGRIIHLNVVQPDRYWPRMCRAMDRMDLMEDERFETQALREKNSIALRAIIKAEFESRDLEDWKRRLTDAEIPFAPQQRLSEVINDPQARANGYFVSFDHPAHGQIEVIDSPIRLSETPASVRLPAPEFNQHTEEILLEAGYSKEDIDLLKEHGIIPN